MYLEVGIPKVRSFSLQSFIQKYMYLFSHRSTIQSFTNLAVLRSARRVEWDVSNATPIQT